jgi:hypothetical protein
MRDKIPELRILIESTKRLYPDRYKVYRIRLRKKLIQKYYNEIK